MAKKGLLEWKILAAIFAVLVVTSGALVSNTGIKDTFFNTTTDVSISGEDSYVMNPGENMELDVTIKFNFVKPPFFPQFLIGTRIGKWVMFRDANINMTTDIALSLSHPEFCTADLKMKN